MTSTKERLASLGKHRRPISITVAGESVDVIYQRPTKLKDQHLTAALYEQWKSNQEMLRTPDSTGESIEDRFKKQLRIHGKENVVAWLVKPALEGLKATARLELKNQGYDEPAEDATDEVKAEYEAKGSEVLTPLIEQAKAEYDERDFESLIEQAAVVHTEELAKNRAQEAYYAHLIADSIIDPESDKLLFDGSQDVLETLTDDAFTQVGYMISKEMEAQKALPLT